MAISSTSVTAFLPAPSGYVVNFENPQRRDLPLAYWVTGVTFIIATLCLAMRVYTRIRIVKDFRTEDWCIILAYLISTEVQAISIRLWVSKSSAVHAWEIPVDRYNYGAMLVTIAASSYTVCLALAKGSLLTFYYRMSQLRWIQVTSVCLGIVILIYTLVLVFAQVFACRPIAKAWNVTITEGTCINRAAVYVSLAVLNIGTDLALLTIPIPMVWKLQMPTVQKIGVVLVFLIGSGTCVTSIVRLVLLLPALTAPDQPWAVTPATLWVNIEANLIIVCCSLPALRLFLRHFAPKFMGDISSSRSRTGPSGHGTADANASSRKGTLRSFSEYGRMDLEEITPSYAMDDRPAIKGWSESHCEYAGKEPTVEVFHREDLMTSSSNASDKSMEKESERQLDDNRILKMEAYSVVSEQRIV